MIRPRPETRVYLSVSAGPTFRTSEPVFATDDPSVVDAALQALVRATGRAVQWDRSPTPAAPAAGAPETPSGADR